MSHLIKNRLGFTILKTVLFSHNLNKPVLMLSRSSHKSFPLYSKTRFFQSLQKLRLNCLKQNAVLYQRCFSSDSEEKKTTPNEKVTKKTSPLMKFDPVLKPEIILTIKNWILTKLVIQPYLDSEFTTKSFTEGAKQALEIVSNLLSQGEFQSLKGLVADEAINEIKSNLSSLNVKERQDIFIKVTDVLFAFPYQIGIIFDDANQKRFAEINVVYHCLSNFDELKSEGKIITESVREDIKICNYRFIREYTKGVQSEWMINRLGHFKIYHFENKDQ